MLISTAGNGDTGDAGDADDAADEPVEKMSPSKNPLSDDKTNLNPLATTSKSRLEH